MAGEIKEVVLALSGGGARGAYHLGVLHYLDEHNIKVKAICATSIGSIVAASYASGISPLEQLEILKSKEIKKIFRFQWFKKAIFDIDLEATVLEKLVPKKKIEDLHIPVYISALNLDNAQETIFTQGNLYEVCKASSALCPVFKPVMIDGVTYVDGGFTNHIPVAPLVHFNTPIIGVNLHPFMYNMTLANFFEYLKRSITVGMNMNVNKAKQICDYFIESTQITNYSILSLKNFDQLFELGYKETQKVLSA